MSFRHELASRLSGCGLDLGPGHMPFPVPDAATVRYVDRLTVAEHLDLFPELVGNVLPEPDVIVDFDTDGLDAFADASEDFIVCSHVIEHVADPIRMLADIHRVLRPGGTAVVVVPDRRRTFDCERSATTLEHLRLDGAPTRVDDAHIIEFLEHAARFWAGTPLEPLHTLPTGDGRAAFIDWHRRRSVHAHCWTAHEFAPLLDGWASFDREDGDGEFAFVCTA